MKDTIYIDKEDEITSVIDSVTSSKEKVVALVLPKKAEVFQSVINMKLLKKAAGKAKKSVVLITSDDSLKTAATSAGLHMAPTLKSKPILPKAEKPQETTSVVEATEVVEEDTGVVSKAAPVAASAGAASAVATAVASNKNDDDEIELDNDDPDDKDVLKTDATPSKKSGFLAGLAGGIGGSKAVATSKDAVNKSDKKRFKIPDFSSFRLRSGLVIGAVALLIAGWVIGFIILPKATITITTDTRRVDVSGDFTLSDSASEFDAEDNIVPAKLVEVTKEDKATVPATGEKNIGKVASGSASFSAQICDAIGSPQDIPAGTTVRSGSNEYRTEEEASFGFDSFDGSCLNFSTGNTEITAGEPGTAYNIDKNSDFTVDNRSNVEGTGSAKGGTDETATVVSQEDITKATEQLTSAGNAQASEELQAKLREAGVSPITQTLKEGESKSQRSAEADTQVAEVTVTRSITYQMLGAKDSDVDALLDDLLRSEKELVNDDQNIRDNGRSSATLQVTNNADAANQTLRLQTVAVLGQTFDEQAIAEQVAGKKRGDIESELGRREGVKDVTVDYSPMWVTTTPKSAGKISIVINEADE